VAMTFVSSPHSARVNRVDQVMLQVCLALVPGTLALVWFFGWGVLINMALATLFAVLAEALVMKLRGRPALPAIGDYSAVVTALLFALTIPPTMPWWMTMLGIVFAIVIVKQLYGGIGYNPFNPAMAGYVFLLISYPVATTSWLPPDVPALLEARELSTLSFLDSARLIFTSTLPEGLTWDAVSAATPLDEMRTLLDQGRTIDEIRASSPLWGSFGGRGWEWVGNWFLLGGLYLLGVSPVLGRGHPRGVLYRDGPGVGLYHSAWSTDLRRGDWRHHLCDPHLGWLSGCGRLRGLVDEHRRTDD